jgi:MSHA biogenesis protein MshO
MNRRARLLLRRTRGFTLMEAIVTIVIIGIVAGMVAVFIRAPILSYRDTVDRAELTDQADLALRRMARDIRLALPNSVRVNANGSALELLPTRSGARYLSAEDGVAPALVLSFDDRNATSFAALAPPATFSQVRAGDYAVVYNLGEGFAPANAYDYAKTFDPAGSEPPVCPTKGGAVANAAGNIACITAATDPATDRESFGTDNPKVPVSRLTIAGNPFARQDTAMTSPEQRFQVVSGPVSFYCEAQADGTLALWRAWGYPISVGQPVPPVGGQRAMVASRLTGCDGLFTYQSSAALQRTGLVVIALELRSRTAGAGAVRLVHQVHVDNTP